MAPRLVLWIAMLAVLLLAACTPAIRDSARLPRWSETRNPAPAIMPHFTDRFFVTTDGVRLPLRKWLPKGPVKAVILALHGFNDYSHAFAGSGEAWAKRGIATYAYDQRGFGAAPWHGRWLRRKAMAIDALAATQVLHRLYPDISVYLLGESMGGAAAIVAMTGETGIPIPKVSGVILAAPAVWGRATMGLAPRVALWLAARLVPGLKLSGRGLGIMPSDNIPMLRALARDPMVIKRTRVDTIWGLVNLMSAALSSAPRLDAPLLLLYGAKDEIIPKQAMRRFVEDLPPHPRHRCTIAYYANGYHMLLRDLEAPLVEDDVAGWILSPGRPLPSGANRDARAALLGRRTRTSQASPTGARS